VDDAAGPFFVGADAFDVEALDSRFDSGFVNAIEVDLEAAKQILLLAERHRDEYQRLHGAPLATSWFATPSTATVCLRA
jgi:hypothetical protein